MRYTSEATMPRRNDHVWGIILAAGDGKRLKHYIRSRFNSDRPKQFCTFIGTRSMLLHTIDRAEMFIPPERIIVTLSSSQSSYAAGDISGLDTAEYYRAAIEQGNERKHPPPAAPCHPPRPGCTRRCFSVRPLYRGRNAVHG